MPKKIINKEDPSPWFTSSQEIGGNYKSETKQKAKGGEEKQPPLPLPQARPSTSPSIPEGSSFARFVNGQSGPSYDHSSFKQQAYLLYGNSPGISGYFGCEEDRITDKEPKAKPADAEQSRQPSTSVRGRGTNTPFLGSGEHPFLGAGHNPSHKGGRR